MSIKTFSVPSSLDEIGTIRSNVHTVSSFFNLNQEKVIDVELILVELFTNIVKHGYKEVSGDVHFDFDCDDQKLKMELRDNASAYFPTMLQTVMPKVHENVNSLAESGYGIPLVVSLIQSIKFERNGDENKTTVIICLD